jgi:hypothetical protein
LLDDRAAAAAWRNVTININTEDIATAQATPAAAAMSGGITIRSPAMNKYGKTA